MDIQLTDPQKLKTREFSQKSFLVSILIYLRTYASIALVVYLCESFDFVLLKVFAIFFIAARQHSLYVLNHDASHEALSKSRQVNKWTAILFSNIPFFHHVEAWSYVQWRRVHMYHHRYLFQQKDPNYVERQLTGDIEKNLTGLGLAKELFRSMTLSWLWFFTVKQDYIGKDGVVQKRKLWHPAAIFRYYKNDREMEVEKWCKILLMSGILLFIESNGFLFEFLFYWILPMYTVYPALLRLMDLTEHDWKSNDRNVLKSTRSIQPGLFEKIFISDLNRSLHREHHLFPGVPLQNLGRLSRYLIAEDLLDRPVAGYRPFFWRPVNDD